MHTLWAVRPSVGGYIASGRTPRETELGQPFTRFATVA